MGDDVVVAQPLSKVVADHTWFVPIFADYLPPTHSKGSRIRVWRGDCKRSTGWIVSWDHGMSPGENYAAAIRSFAADMGWCGRWIVATSTSFDACVAATGVWAGDVCE